MNLLAGLSGIALAILACEFLYRQLFGTRFRQALRFARAGLQGFAQAQGDTQRQVAAINGGLSVLSASLRALLVLLATAGLAAGPALYLLPTAGARGIYTASFTLCSVTWLLGRRWRHA